MIADAAHSIGSQYGGIAAAKKSDITIFSFHAVKNITTAEGGCICLNLPPTFDVQDEYNYLKLYTLNGQNKDALAKSKGGGWRYDILFQGLKINMPDICAAIGLAQIMKYSQVLMTSRKAIATQYYKSFKNQDWFVAPSLADGERETCYHLFPLRIKGISEQQRDRIIDKMTSLGIAVNVHFIPLPMLTYFKSLGYKIEDFPIAYKNYAHEISLPIYPQLTKTQIKFISTSLIKIVNEELTSVQTEKIESEILIPS